MSESKDQNKPALVKPSKGELSKPVVKKIEASEPVELPNEPVGLTTNELVNEGQLSLAQSAVERGETLADEVSKIEVKAYAHRLDFNRASVSEAQAIITKRIMDKTTNEFIENMNSHIEDYMSDD